VNVPGLGGLEKAWHELRQGCQQKKYRGCGKKKATHT
jgi:hypothetical protein